MKLLPHLLFLWGLLFVSRASVFSQPYPHYYSVIHTALEAQYEGKHAFAITHFDSAFSLVPYVHIQTYEKAALSALAVKDHPKAYEWIKKAISQGANPQFWKTDVSREFKKTAYSEFIQDSSRIWEEAAQRQINQPYLALIDSLYYLDQRIIRNNRRVKGDYEIDRTTLPENLFELDEAIWDTLLAAIDRWRFPSEQVLGSEGQKKVDIILLHNGRLEENTDDLPMLRAAVLAGHYPPDDFAGMYDQRLMFMGKEPFFYVLGKVDPKTLSDSEKEEVDKRRAELGVKPRSAYKVTIRKRSATFRRLW